MSDTCDIESQEATIFRNHFSYERILTLKTVFQLANIMQRNKVPYKVRQ